MVVLGLGSNLGNRLENLSVAVKLLKEVLANVKLSLVYETDALLPIDSVKKWDLPFYNMVIAGDCLLPAQELLKKIKQIEMKMGRTRGPKWSPRIIDIDILFYHDEIFVTDELTVPHKELLSRKFVMLPLYHILPQFVHPMTGTTIEEIIGDFRDYIGSFKRVVALNPKIMGIVNVTPDSFSDGGKYAHVNDAISHSLKLINDGVTVLDIGAQSTNPKSNILPWQIEVQRLSPILEGLIGELNRDYKKIQISIDTFYPEVIETLCEKFQIDIINDVSGLSNIRMIDIAKANNMKYVLMHSLSIPANSNNLMPFKNDISEELLRWAKKNIKLIVNRGLPAEQIIFDPGIGFGKTPSQSLSLIRNIKKFKKLNLPLLLGYSRKSFMNTFATNVFAERDFETSIISSLISKDIDYLRVHNVQDIQKALVIQEVLNL